MQLEIEVGESLTIKTVRGVVVLHWIDDSEDLTVTTFFDQKITTSVVKMVNTEVRIAAPMKCAGEIRLSSLEG